MRIIITLDDVIRAKTVKICKTYKKYFNKDLQLQELDLSSGNLGVILGFKTKKDYEQFLYEDFAYEIFAEADLCERGLEAKFRSWLMSLSNVDGNGEPVEVIIANNMEFGPTIGFTQFFLAKMGTTVREFLFPKNTVELWKKADVIVTADKTLLGNKLDGKVSVKIVTDYNEDIESDMEYNTLTEIFDDKEFFNKLTEKQNKND